MKYKVIDEKSLPVLISEVQAHLGKGCKPQGGITQIKEASYVWMYAQALTYKELQAFPTNR